MGEPWSPGEVWGLGGPWSQPCRRAPLRGPGGWLGSDPPPPTESESACSSWRNLLSPPSGPVLLNSGVAWGAWTNCSAGPEVERLEFLGLGPSAPPGNALWHLEHTPLS